MSVNGVNSSKPIDEKVYEQDIWSSNHASHIKHDGISTLTIEYSGRGTYEYYGVPLSVYLAIVNSSSKGNAINTLVKGIYPYVRI